MFPRGSSCTDEVIRTLHSAHQGVSSMESRARSIVFWPGMSTTIQDARDKCSACNKIAPSQAATPPAPLEMPSTPFESVFADFCNCGGCNYLIVGDRLSSWVEIYKAQSNTASSGADGLISCLRRLFATFGVPEILSSDGGPEFTASRTSDFLSRWGVRHRISSVAFPQSNGRAEVAVKKAKRTLMDNIGPTGSLNNDGLLRAMLQLRNTPDPDCKVSPAEVIFGRPIRDAFSFVNRRAKFVNKSVRPIWREAWHAKEKAMRARYTRTTEKLGAHSRALSPLKNGMKVYVQNQQGHQPNKCDRSGTIVNVECNDLYLIKIDGTGRLTLRNRRFLRIFVPGTAAIGDPLPWQRVSSPTLVCHQPALVTSPPDRIRELQASPSLSQCTPELTVLPPTPEAENPFAPDKPAVAEPYISTDRVAMAVTPSPTTTLQKVPAAVLTTPEPTPTASRVPRTHRPPRRYDPESGLWLP